MKASLEALFETILWPLVYRATHEHLEAEVVHPAATPSFLVFDGRMKPLCEAPTRELAELVIAMFDAERARRRDPTDRAQAHGGELCHLCGSKISEGPGFVEFARWQLSLCSDPCHGKVEMTSDREKLVQIAGLIESDLCLDAGSYCETISKILLHRLTPFNQVNRVPHGGRISVVCRPNAYRLRNIVGGTRVGIVTLCMVGGNLEARVRDALVEETATLLTGIKPVRVQAIVQVHQRDYGEERTLDVEHVALEPVVAEHAAFAEMT